MGDCVPSLLFTWGQTMVEIMKIMVTSFKRSHACTLHSVPPALQQGTDDPRLRQRLLDTHRQVWVSLLWGHWSFLLRPGTQGSVCALQAFISQSCVSSGGSVVGLMATSSKRAYSLPRSTAPRAQPWQQSTADLYLLRRHANTVLSQSLWGLCVLVHTRYVWAIWASLADTGFDSKCEFTPLPSC